MNSLRVRLGYYQGPRLMSFLRKRWALFRNPLADVTFGNHVYLGPGFSIHAPFGGRLVVGDQVEFRRGFRLELVPDAEVTIGPHTRFTYDTIIQCGKRIDIGAHCIIGRSVIVDGNHRFRGLDRPVLEQGYDLRPLKIADGVSIMSNCTVINDIGERAFVGANAVVSKPVPAYTLAVGVPARPIDYFGASAGSSSETSGASGRPSASVASASSQASRK